MILGAKSLPSTSISRSPSGYKLAPYGRVALTVYYVISYVIMINVIAEGRKECLYTPTPGFHLRGLSELCL